MSTTRRFRGCAGEQELQAARRKAEIPLLAGHASVTMTASAAWTHVQAAEGPQPGKRTPRNTKTRQGRASYPAEREKSRKA
jgi:hypothetical protein